MAWRPHQGGEPMTLSHSCFPRVDPPPLAAVHSTAVVELGLAGCHARCRDAKKHGVYNVWRRVGRLQQIGPEYVVEHVLHSRLT